MNVIHLLLIRPSLANVGDGLIFLGAIFYFHLGIFHFPFSFCLSDFEKCCSLCFGCALRIRGGAVLSCLYLFLCLLIGL